MAITLDVVRNYAIPNTTMTPLSLKFDVQASNHPRIMNTSNMLALSRKSWSPINMVAAHPSPRTSNHAYNKKTHLSSKIKHATRLPCLKIRCRHTMLNDMWHKDGKDNDQSRSQVIARCEMEPKGREPTPGHDEQQHSCGEKKYIKRDHSPGHDEHQNKSCNKKLDAHLEPKSGSEWHDIFRGELREWKGMRGPKRDEHCEEDPCHEYTNGHGGCEDEDHAYSSLNATYKGYKASLFPMTSYGPNFYAPIGNATFHYHFSNPS